MKDRKVGACLVEEYYIMLFNSFTWEANRGNIEPACRTKLFICSGSNTFLYNNFILLIYIFFKIFVIYLNVAFPAYNLHAPSVMLCNDVVVIATVYRARIQ